MSLLSTQIVRRQLGTRMLLPLAFLAAIAPFATDLYLASFPAMVTALNTTEAGVQLSLTTFLVGAGAGQAIFGPVSDRFGRKKPLLIGLSIAVAASMVSALAPTIEILVGARLVQGGNCRGRYGHW